jgi:CRISPR-associated protein Csm1
MNDEFMNKEQVHMAALAGLVHDIGKFAQRAGVEPGAKSQALGMEDYGKHGAHAKWSVSFIHDHVPERWHSGLAPVLYHHKPQDFLSKVVALAAQLSAAEHDEVVENDTQQLLSILCRVGKEEQRPEQQFWPLEPLSLNKNVLFPGDALPKKEEGNAYNTLWGEFTEAIGTLPDDDLPTYLEGVYYALHRFTWCIPGTYYKSLPDVSLFDHSRTTAALATCLSLLNEPALDDLLKGKRRDESLMLLVGGDLSGVQDFIYTVTAKGAAKGLRGRSFYLQVLTEAVARYLLRRLKLPVTNLLYASGGHFYLLAPLDAKGEMEKARTDVSRKLLTHHLGDLYLALGWTGISTNDFDRKHFGKKWGKVSEAMNEAKRHRFAELDDASMLTESVFGPMGDGGGEERECQVCHYDGLVGIEHRGGEEERRICAFCKSLEALGTDLRDAGYLLLGEIEPEETERAGYAEALRSFGLTVGFIADNGRAILRLPDTVQRATLLAMHDLPDVTETAKRISQGCDCPIAPKLHYTVNVTPHKGDSIATFEDLQAASRGVKRLGVLRMDVDDLGDLLKWGMEENATISRIASFNFAMSLFFEGWVGELCRQINAAETNDRVYAIYSGGDDLFIVGAWDVLPGLANTIRQDLARFAAHNLAVHISGGLTLHSGKYPLYQAARDAEEALDAAKDLERPGDRHAKDAFHFLERTIPWEEFNDLQQKQEWLARLVSPKDDGGLDIRRTLLHVLLRLYAHFTDAVYRRGKPYWGPWMWRSAYYLKRMEGQQREKEAQVEIKQLRDILQEDDFRSIETLGPAARWAELLARKGDEV